MVQEAKASCRGKWYLPAGRMERNESIVDAVKREVKEESGLDFEPEALLCIECHAHSWVRFTLGGRIVGGALKTVAEADRESLQAQWQPAEKTKLLHSVELRAHDVLKLISIARRWYGGGKPYRGTPVAVGHVSCSLRLVVVRESSTGCLEGLVRGGEGGPRLPVSLFTHYHEGGIQAAVTKTLKGCGYEGEFRVVGVVHVEHVGKAGWRDGFCLSLLVRLPPPGELEVGGATRWRWEKVEGECGERVRAALNEDPPGCATLIDLTSRHF
ncbi:8-oxo-dGDP phosphatase NUDT18 [Geodia barretti]|nr:8-oxo-dGDP phosphatase NUDT18 [Geodia barretti]